MWQQYKKLILIITAAIAVHFIKNLIVDGQISDMILVAGVAGIAGKMDAGK